MPLVLAGGKIISIGGAAFLVPSSGGSLTITTGATLPNGTQGQPYSQVFAATGGTPPYQWTFTGAANPFGTVANGFGPLPTQAINLNVLSGTLQGNPLPLAEVDSITVTVTDSVGGTGSKTFSLTTTAATLFQLVGQFDTQIDSNVPSTYMNVNAWNGGSGYGLLGYGSKSWSALIPQPYSASNIQGYPYAGRGWYPGITNICTPANGGSFSGAGSTACIQISALTKAVMRCVIDLPVDRTQAEYDGLYDMYVYNAATPTGGATGQFDTPPGTQILFALSVFTNFLDSAQYWESFIGTANPTVATLGPSDYNTVTAGGGNIGGRLEMDGRMWFVAFTNENWAVTPSAGKYNTCRMFPAPWNEIHQVGSMYLTLDVSNMLRDLLASSYSGNLPFTSAHYFSGPMMGMEANGLSTHYSLSAVTKANPMVYTVSTVIGTNPFAVGDRVGFASAGGMTQINNKRVATITAIGGSSGAWTATTNIDSTAFTTYTSGGYAHKAVFDVLDFQTSLQTEPNIVINTVPEICKNIGRHVPVSASADAGGALVAANAVTANYNLYWTSNGTASGGSPVHFGMNFNGYSSSLKADGLITWDGIYHVGGGNSDYYLGSVGAGASYWLMGDYTIDGNPSTSGTYPTTGWTTLATITGNLRRSRAHYIGDWSAYNWLRFNCTSASSVDTQGTIGFHCDVLNAPKVSGLCDGWFFLGDSIVNKCMLPGDSEEGGANDQFGNMMYNITGHMPISHDAGNSGWALSLNSNGYTPTIPFIDGTSGDWLGDFPGRYVWYGLGYNDPAASVSQSTYQTTLTNFINIALSKGKTVIVPSIMYTFSDSGATSTTWSGYNANVVATFAGNPRVITGPDLNTIFKNIKQIAFNSHDTIHPSPYGQPIFQGIVTDWIGRVIYLGQPVASWKVPFVCGTGTHGFGGIAGPGE